MAGPLKRSTFFAGLQVATKPRETLLGLYNQTMAVLNRMPEDAHYRKETEKLTQDRLKLVQQESDVSKLESLINDGQIEEVIMQAKSELSLAEKMEEWKAWEPLQTEAPPGQWKWP
eukprot:gene7539-8377_t